MAPSSRPATGIDVPNLGQALDSAGLAWWEMDCRTGAVRFHPRKTELLGYEAEAFRHYSDFTALLHPEDLPLAMRAMQDHLEGTLPSYQLDYRIRAKTGEYLWFHDIGRISHRDEAGRPLLVTGIVLDVSERKRAERRLAESEERLREVLENSLDASYKRSLENNAYVYLSPVFTRIAGYTPEEMRAMPIEEVVSLMHPEDHAEVQSIVAGALKGRPGAAYHFEYRFRHRDGQYRWLHDQFTVVHDTNGHPSAFIGSVRDITQRKQVELALLASEDRFRTLFQNHTATTLLIDPDTGSIIDANVAAAHFYGWSIRELVAMRVQQLNALPPEEVQRAMAAARAGKKGSFEFRHRRADGSLVDVEVFSNPVEVEGRVLLHSIVHDISDRKRAEDALRTANARLCHAERFARFGHWEFSLGEQVMHASDGAIRIYGFTENRIPLATVKDCALPKHRPRLDRALRDLIENNQPYDMEFEITRASDGKVITVHSRAEHDAETRTVFGVVQDVTERRQIEIERENLILQLQSALEHIRTLKGIVPICTHCKKIRDDKGFWEQVEAYVSRYTEARFSHGVCPDCLQKYYPE